MAVVAAPERAEALETPVRRTPETVVEEPHPPHLYEAHHRLPVGPDRGDDPVQPERQHRRERGCAQGVLPLAGLHVGVVEAVERRPGPDLRALELAPDRRAQHDRRHDLRHDDRARPRPLPVPWGGNARDRHVPEHRRTGDRAGCGAALVLRPDQLPAGPAQHLRGARDVQHRVRGDRRPSSIVGLQPARSRRRRKISTPTPCRRSSRSRSL